MPNIEIHGLPGEEAGELKDKIFDLFQDSSFIDEVVVTVYPTVVMDKDGKNQPFLRLVNTPESNIRKMRRTREILERLQTLGIDIEHLKLVEFIPKKLL